MVALRNGAKDYVLKGNLFRLPAAVEKALKETEERRAWKMGRNVRNGQARPETKERITRWRAMAAAIANKHPAFNQIQIARAIQQSRAGKRKGDVLPYSISAILKYIRKG